MDQSAPHRVVVTGLGAIASLGHTVDAFWASLVAGRSGIDRVTQFDTTDYACQIGAEVRDWDAAQHMDPKDARRNDRLHAVRLLRRPPGGARCRSSTRPGRMATGWA